MVEKQIILIGGEKTGRKAYQRLIECQPGKIETRFFSPQYLIRLYSWEKEAIASFIETVKGISSQIPGKIILANPRLYLLTRKLTSSGIDKKRIANPLQKLGKFLLSKHLTRVFFLYPYDLQEVMVFSSYLYRKFGIYISLPERKALYRPSSSLWMYKTEKREIEKETEKAKLEGATIVSLAEEEFSSNFVQDAHLNFTDFLL